MEIFDIETLSNCFTATFINPDTKKVNKFVIHESRDDRKALLKFLQEVDCLVGYNNLRFDYPVIHSIMNGGYDPEDIYEVAQTVINDEFPEVRSPSIPQIDLMRIHHFDNPARMASLKWLQINMNFSNVQDMPFHHTHHVLGSEIDLILEYNLNDVMATLELFKRSKSHIEMRRTLSDKYEVDMTNFSNPKIGEYIVLKMLSARTGTPITTLKKCRTPRPYLKISDCILPTISFKTKEFQKIHEDFKKMVITDTSEPDDMVSIFDGVEYYFGMGGIHACRSSGILHNIHSSDVTGYYPTLAVSQGFTPAHFGRPFTDVYRQIGEERKQYAKGTADNIALKLAANAVFGKSNSEFSPFYDPMFFTKITVNGQLLLAMLCERITLEKCGRIMMANTDGIELEIFDQEKFDWLCGHWETKFGLKLEHSKYKTLVVRDINNYLGVTDKGKIKQKGVFETHFDKDGSEELVLHKDHSMQIVPHAVREYVTKGIPVEQTVNSCTDPTMFMVGSRAKTGGFVAKSIDNVQPLPKHIRYYMSKSGIQLFQDLESGMKCMYKGVVVTLANELPDKLVNLDKRYYIRECHKLITSTSAPTMSLF